MSETKAKWPTGPQYRAAEIALALSFCPTISPCAKCGWPVVSGYCCTFCKTGDPSRADDPEGK